MPKDMDKRYVIAAAAAVYANTLAVPFVFDDWSTVQSSATARDLSAWWAALGWGWNRALGDLTFALNRTLLGDAPAGRSGADRPQDSARAAR